MLAKKFEEQVRLNPDKVAVKADDQELTYSELNQASNAVAYEIMKNRTQTNKLSDAELTRYSRQMLLDRWGVHNQEKLKATTVFVAGAGGSGSPVIQQLALLGIGTIIICDFDEVELSNLNRQVLHDDSRIGLNKAISARMTVEKLNPHVKVIVYTEKITRENVEEMIGDSQVIFDNVDDMEAKFILSEYAVKQGVPHVLSSMIDINSYAVILYPPYTPCFHCLYDRSKLEEIKELRALSTARKTANPVSAPALFVSTGFIVNEVVKILIGNGQPAYNRYFLFNQKGSEEIAMTDGHLAITYPFSEHFRRISREQGFDWFEGWRGKFVEELEISPDPACPLCGAAGAANRHSNNRESDENLSINVEDHLEDGEKENVALLFQHGADMIIGLMGAVKARKTYVPLDAAYPEDRLVYMLIDSGAELLVTNTQNLVQAQSLLDRVERYVRIINLDDLDLNRSVKNPELPSKTGEIAYILYTSGSTGEPKGVMQSYENVNYYITRYVEKFAMTDEDRLTLFSAYSHDAAVMDIYAALFIGATVYPKDLKNKLSLSEVMEWVIREKITIWHSVPTVYRYFLKTLTGDERFSNLRYIILGGEEVLESDVLQFQRYFADNTVLATSYGLTEATYNASQFYRIDTPFEKGLGQTVEGTELLIIGENGKRVRPLRTGEIVIASNHVALGYWNKPEKTEQVFGISPELNSRVYRTGDLGKLWVDGSIEFIGRKDFQVKIRGYRVELGEIESRLLNQESIKEAAIIARADEDGEKSIYAFYELQEEISADKLRTALASQLPDYMVPAFFIKLEQMPVTPTGKIDRKALLEIEVEHGETDSFVAPTNPMEARLAEVCGRVLKKAKVGIDDDFFALGGNSLKATYLLSEINKEFNVNLPIREIFLRQTVKGIAELIERTEQKQFVAIERLAEQEYYPVSSAQKRIYLLDQITENSTAYNMPRVYMIEGRLNQKAFNRGIQKLVKRHDALRTSFTIIQGEPVQRIAEDSKVEIQYLRMGQGELTAGRDYTWSADLEQLSAESIVYLQKVITKMIKPFDLSQSPLLRVSLIELNPEKHLFFYDLHHIISDGTSMTLLVQEFIQFYYGQELPELRIQYRDFAAWQNELLKSKQGLAQEEYWLSVFAEQIPVLELPLDRPRPVVLDFAGARIGFQVDLARTERLKALAASQGASLFMILLAVYNLLLARYSGQEDIVIGTPIAGRDYAELEKIIGMFVNTLALRNRPQGQKTFIEFLQKVKETTFRAYDNQNYQFELLVEKLNLQRDMGRNPLFDVMFTLQNMDLTANRVSGLEVKPVGFENNMVKFDLNLIGMETAEGIYFNLEYRTSIFKKQTIERMIEHYINLLTGVIEHPTEKISAFELMTVEEKNQLLFVWNTARTVPVIQPIHQLFENQVEQSAEKLAIVSQGEKLTYRELNERANQLARFLRERGVLPDRAVGLMLDQSPEMVVSLLAVLKAGGCYLPLDSSYPVNRIVFMLKDSEADLLLVRGRNSQIDWETHWQGEVVDLTDLDLADYSTMNLNHLNNPTDLAYIMYTSGSTGQPKGVLIPHQGIVRLVNDPDYLELSPDERIMQMAPYTFDASTFEIWASLVHGAQLILIAKDLVLSLDELARTIEEQQITTCWLTSSLFNRVIDEIPSCLQGVRNLLVGGEALSVPHIQKALTILPETKLINGYGPTENTTFTCCYPIKELAKGSQSVPIGRPINNTTVYILDRYLQPVPIGVPGELYVVGDGLARGYLNQPELTEKVFVNNPFAENEKMYKTGDLARWLPDGNIEFWGRLDDQLKIRGFRIEPGEIENHLLAHPEIRETVVVPYMDSRGLKDLAAYIVGEREFSSTELREYITAELPEYMVPTYFVQLPEMPLNINGKIDRQALPEPVKTLLQTGYVAPTNQLEESLVEIWSEVLGVEQIGITDNFYEIGGNSLKATYLVSRIYQEFDVNIPIREIFRRQTVSGIAEFLAAAEKGSYASIEKLPDRSFYPVSSAQKRLFLLDQISEHSTAYNLPWAGILEGPLDLERLTTVLQTLVQRHESLRTSFTIIQGEPVQQIHQDVLLEIEYFRVTSAGLQKEDAPDNLYGEMESAELTDSEPLELVKSFVRSFDLSTAPLLRVGLIQLGTTRHLLIYDLHHIITDGTSIGILLREFVALYSGEELPELKLQYRDYAAWQNQLLTAKKGQEQEEYWVERFRGEIPTLDLPTDKPRPAVLTFEGERVNFQIDREVSDRLNQLAALYDATPFMILLAIYNLLLARYTGQEDIIIGSPTAGRDHLQLENIIGMFVNTLALRSRPVGDITFAEFIKEVTEDTFAAYANQNYQFEMLVERLELPRNLSRNPLFDVMFVLQNMDNSSLNIRDLQIKPLNYANKVAKFDLTLTGMEGRAGYFFTIEYRTSLFKKQTIERMARHFINLLKAVVEDPTEKLSAIQMLTTAEKERIVYQWNDTKATFISRPIHQFFEDQVIRDPEQIAVVSSDGEITYWELNQRANQLARFLRERGVQVDVPVGLMFDRSVEMLVSILGVLKAGGCYLPISLKYPVSRINYLLADSGAHLLLTKEEYLQKLSEGSELAFEEIAAALEMDLQSAILDFDRLELQRYAASNLDNLNSVSDLAYIIYTSGSTGQPKGVLLEHKGVANLRGFIVEELKVTSTDRVVQFSPWTFDPSVFEIWMAFFTGAALYLVSEEIINDYRRFEEFLQKNQISVLQLPPVYLEYLSPERLDSLRILCTGGSTISRQLVDRWRNKLIYRNLYGPTETTIFTTAWIAEDSWETFRAVPIGKPILNTQIYILDAYLNPVAEGVVGEIFVGGPGVARGYLNRPEQTRASFIHNHFTGEGLLYRTGDRGKWLTAGLIEFVGRNDEQVKIRGYRVEPGEIEAHLSGYPQIREVVVAAIENTQGMKDLAAYFTADGTIALNDLRIYLELDLPEFMIPGYFIQLEKMPITSTGKIDRQALPDPGKNLVRTEYLAPTNEIEEKLTHIWSEILGVEQVGINDNFYVLGGNSLKATTLVARIYRELGVNLQVKQVFIKKTVQALGRLIANTQRGNYLKIERIEDREYYPVSSAQKRLYILDQFMQKSVTYNMPQVVRIKGRLDRERFAQTIRKLVQRHESLRTSFAMIKSEPVQIVHQNVQVRIEYLQGNEEQLAELIRAFIRPFELDKAPLFRVGLIELEPETHLFIYDLHHIISDGTSMGILMREFAQLYAGQDLPALDIQYRDYAVAQNSLLNSELGQQQEQYWLNQFTDQLSVLDLPLDKARPSVMTYDGDQVSFSIDSELTLKLKELAVNSDATLFIVLLAIYNLFIAKYSGQDDIIIGTPIAGRDHADTEKIIGMFVNTLALRNKPQARMTYREFLAEVRNNTFQAYENQSYQFEMLVDKLDLVRDMSRNPLFDVLFTLQNMDTTPAGETNLQISPYRVEKTVAKFDLSLFAAEVGETIHFSLEYRTSLWKKSTVERMAGHFSQLIRQVVRNPDRLIAEIDLATTEEREQILASWQETVRLPITRTVQQLFAEQVVKTPERVAVSSQNKTIAYRELNERANRLARVLRERGVEINTPVGLVLNQSPELIVSLLAVLKAGGCYLPIDASYPRKRIQYMLTDSDTKLVLINSEDEQNEESRQIIENLTHWTGEMLDIAHLELADYPSTNLEDINSPEDLIYIMYTSGSTGTPKGVMVEHQGVVRLVREPNYLELTDNERIMQMAPYTFDASTFEIWVSLLNGCQLILVPRELVLSLNDLSQLMQQQQVTTCWLTSSLFNRIIDEVPEALQGLRNLLVGGEALSVAHIRKALELLPETTLINGYGPTENTTFTCCYRISGVPADMLSIPLGRPINNTTVYILDQDLNPVPIGVYGEIYTGGSGLARGYLNNHQLTRKKFIANPFIHGGRLYRTGDKGRWLSDGTIEFGGRMDDQLKVRGFRIEPGEIENRLLSHPDIREVIVLAYTNRQGTRDLTAYITADRELSITELREFVGTELPEYMIPAYFVQLAKLPLNINGKIDRQSLPEPDKNILRSEYLAPETETEIELARIWAETLGVERVGVTDDFYELGGQSLKATVLVRKIYQQLGVEIALREIFQRPQINDLARYIDQAAHADKANQLEKDKNLILLRTGKAADKHHFFIHAGSGEVGAYLQLVEYLDPVFNYWGIRLEGMENYESQDVTIEELAAKYLAIIQEVQPSGPYQIGGWSIGGTIAFEMVNQLEILGEEVAFISIIDSQPPKTPEWRKMVRQMKKLNPDSPEFKESIPQSLARSIPDFAQLGKDDLIKYVNIIRDLSIARAKYVPKRRIQSQLHYFEANQQNFINRDDWNRYCQLPMMVHQVSGDHFSIFVKPAVIGFGKKFCKIFTNQVK